MQEVEFTILDATHAAKADIAKYRKLIRDYRYKVFCIDFSDMQVEFAKERNLKSLRIKSFLKRNRGTAFYNKYAASPFICGCNKASEIL